MLKNYEIEEVFKKMDENILQESLKKMKKGTLSEKECNECLKYLFRVRMISKGRVTSAEKELSDYYVRKCLVVKG